MQPSQSDRFVGVDMLEARFKDGLTDKEVRWTICIIDGIANELFKPLLSPSIRSSVLIFLSELNSIINRSRLTCYDLFKMS